MRLKQYVCLVMHISVFSRKDEEMTPEEAYRIILKNVPRDNPKIEAALSVIKATIDKKSH